jgi:hypothetical protein
LCVRSSFPRESQQVAAPKQDCQLCASISLYNQLFTSCPLYRHISCAVTSVSPWPCSHRMHLLQASTASLA